VQSDDSPAGHCLPPFQQMAAGGIWCATIKIILSYRLVAQTMTLDAACEAAPRADRIAAATDQGRPR